MSTNRLQFKDVDQFMADYNPVYQPVYGLFLGNSQQYSEEVGQLNFKRLEAVGDIRAKHLTPKDTDIRQIAATEKSKIFKKYFLANQFVQSNLQDQSNVDQIVKQVLDEHHKQADDLLFLGEGTSNATVVNSGLYWSGDANHVTDNSIELHNAPDTQNEMFDAVMADLQSARDIPGRKVIMVYGSTAISKLDSLVPSQVRTVNGIFKDVLEANESIFRVPSQVGLGSVNGWIIANMDQVKLHYTALPKLDSQGINEEKKYSWHNFLMGSMMLEVLTYGAVRRQPVTFEA